MKRRDYSDFDIISFLEDNDIEYRQSGKNVGKGWIGITCPFCEGRGFHGGINLTHKVFSCWQCAETASPPKLVKQILNCSWVEAYRKIESLSLLHPSQSTPQTHVVREWPLRPVQLPVLTGSLVGPGGTYLKSRGFDPKTIETAYGVKEIGPAGDYKFRLIIPIYFKKKLVSFTTRDYTGLIEPKYKAQPIEDAVIPVKDCLYNIDSVKDKLLIVEGPADVWRMGNGAVALFGISCSEAQQEMLFNWYKMLSYWYKSSLVSRKKKVVILLDPKTRKPADKLYYALSSFIRNLKIVELTDLDPGDLTQEAAMNLKAQIF